MENTVNFSKKKIAVYFAFAILFLVCFYFLFFSAPKDFPDGAVVNIGEGASLRSASLELQNLHIIRSRTAFEAFVIMYGGERHVIPADYLFEESVPVFEVARRISKGERHLAPVKVTIPEGFTTQEIADAFVAKLQNFNKEKFLIDTQGYEGYLFPDTYFFFTTDNEQNALQLMNDNFDKKIRTVSSEIVSSGKTEKDIIIMASLVEGEAKGDADRGLISGILWRRLSIGMALQADAAPETYKVRGLPKNPIGNPGLEAIKAALHPVSSPYLYYLHDPEGGIHFARTFEEHKQNKVKYLNAKP